VVSADPEDRLYRRLHVSAVHAGRVNRLAFMTGGEYDVEISVDLVKLRASPDDCIRDKPDFGVGVLSVADVISLGFSVRHDPQEDNFAHTLILGENNKQIASMLAMITEIVIFPSSP
jgi:hypothetical protein